MAMKYTPSQANIETGSTNYNVSPNLSTSRGLEKVSEALQKGMQYKTQEEEMAFTRRQTDLRNTISTFNEEYAEASFAERKLMAKELEDLKTGDTGRDNKWDRELDRMGKEFSSRVNINLAQETEQRRKAAAAKARAAARAAQAAARNNRIANQQIAYLELQRGMAETTDVAEQRTMTNDYYAAHVTPYEDSDDPEAKKMYIRGLSDYNRANSFVINRRRSIADQQITTDVMAGVQAEVISQGGITEERILELREPLTQRSDYEENQSAINQQFADLVLSAIQTPFNEPNYVPTEEDVAVYSAQLADIAKADPYVVGSQSYRVAQNFGSTLAATVNRQQEVNLQSMLNDGTVSPAVYDKQVDLVLDKGIISEEEASDYKFRKAATNTESNQRAIMAQFVNVGDVAGLRKALDEEPRLNPNTARNMVGETLADTFQQLLGREDVTVGANVRNALNTAMSFKNENLAPTKLPFIDKILNSPRNGMEMTNQEVVDFMETYEAATEYGYFKGGSGNPRVTADYLALKGMMEMGVPNIGETLFNARQNRISVKQNDVDNAILQAMDANPRWSENLSEQNQRFLLSAFRPTAKTMMEGGFSPADVEDFAERTLDDNWMRVDPRFGGSSEVFIPRTTEVPDGDSYTRAYDAINENLKGSGFARLDYLAPISASDPEGIWIAVDKDGNVARFTNKEIGIVSRTGKLPN
jgi:hypothetical protein